MDATITEDEDTSISAQSLTAWIAEDEANHSGALKGKSGQSEDWEAGFLKGLQYVREHIIPILMETDGDNSGCTGGVCPL